MIKPIISTKFALPFIAASTMLFGSCFDNSKKLHDYMEDKGYKQIELDSVLEATKRYDIDKESAVRQKTVDSMAYRDLFNSTSLTGDSAIVAEFNKIAAKASLENIADNSRNIGVKCREHIYNTAISDGLDIEGATELKNILHDLQTVYVNHDAIAAMYQYYSDMYFYGIFFAKNGLLDNENFANKFNETAKMLEVK